MSDILSTIQKLILDSATSARGRSLSRRHRRDPNRPAGKWTSTARIGKETGTALAIVLGTIGCSHALGESGGCTMCSYLLDGSSDSVSSEELLNQFSNALKEVKDIEHSLSIKIYTSGSFLDTEEVPHETRVDIVATIAKNTRVREVVIESRPEFITDESLSELRTLLGDRHIEMGIGLESSSDWIRNICINKGFSTEDFKNAVNIAQKYNIGTRAYVLLKPPFLTERDALLDSLQTIKDSIEMGVTTVSMNPVNVQKSTLVEQLWSRGLYRPPWLWTVIEVLREAKTAVGESVNIVCDPVAAGKVRGTHNCGTCDEAIVQSIRKFSLSQDVSDLQSHDCGCKKTWLHILNHEDISLMIHRYFSKEY
ncbi:MAG: archaeosine biosynthesis radical SAM protein RaSEA [Candidatus Thorarchaeota archaeon]